MHAMVAAAVFFTWSDSVYSISFRSYLRLILPLGLITQV